MSSKKTPNLNMNKWDEKDSLKPFRSELNDNFDKLDELDGTIKTLTTEVNEKVSQSYVDDEVGTLTAQLAETINSVNQRNILVTDYGAIGDYGITDNTVFFKNALLIANSHEYTLFIPAGGFYISETLEINCNVICLGEILIPNNVAKTFIKLPYGEKITISGVDAFNSIIKGQIGLDLKTLTEVDRTELGKYYYNISSTEILMNRLGFVEKYYKNESGDIKYSKSSKVSVVSPLIHTYNDLSLVTLTLYKKMENLTIEGLKIKRITKGANTPNQQVILINRNNVTLNNLVVDNQSNIEVSSGVKIENTNNVVFNNAKVKNIYGNGDYYPLLVINSSFIYLNKYSYEEVGSLSAHPKRGYSARHGNHIYFNDCILFGLGDHYGSNYFVNDSTIMGEGVLYAGHNLNIKDTTFLNCEYPIQSRTDTPHCTGELRVENCIFDACRNIVHYQRLAVEDVLEVDKLKFFDVIRFSNVKVKNTSKNGYDAGTLSGKGIFICTSIGANAQVINIQTIIFHKVESDIPFINFHQPSKITIDSITIDDCTTTSLNLDRRGLFINPASDREININLININKSDNMSMLISSLTKVTELIYENSTFNNSLDTLTSYYIQGNSMVIKFINCTIGKDTRITNNSLVGFKGCTFTGIRTNHVVGKSEQLLYSKGNIAEIVTPPNLVPSLVDYVNPTYYQ